MYVILFFLFKYLLVCVYVVGRCWKFFKIVLILKVLYFVYDNVIVLSDFLVWLILFYFLIWWFIFCRIIVMVVLLLFFIRVDI